MTETGKVLAGLVLGLGVGVIISSAAWEPLVAVSAWVEPAGTLWVNALRMTIVPLVVAGLVAGAASAEDPRSLGRLGGRAAALFLTLLTGAAAVTVVVVPVLFSGLALDPDGAAALRTSAAAAGAPDAAEAVRRGLPNLGEWLVDLVPANPVRAAADGAILPLIAFSIAFGLATSLIGAEPRRVVALFFRGLFDAMLVLVRWVLTLAPYGVFALALPLASRLGLASAGALAYYVAVVTAMCGMALVLLYVVAAALGRMPLRRFAAGVAPAQGVAFSSRSSLASLPAMIEGGERLLGFGPRTTSFLLPLSAATFRVGGAIAIPTGALFLCHLYGIALEASDLAVIAVTSVLVTFTIPGIPGGSILVMVPVLMAVGVPPHGVGLLLGVDTIPDMFRTTTNVTGAMTAATVLSRDERHGPGRSGPTYAPRPRAHVPNRRFQSS